MTFNFPNLPNDAPKIPQANNFSFTPLLDHSTLSKVLPDGTRICTLPQDHMPCIVPPTFQYNMPVLKSGITPYTIPNPAHPAPAKPNPLSEDQLRKLMENKLKIQ